MINILEEEVSQFISADRYERTPGRRDQRAGHRSRSIGTTAGVIDDLPVPRTRGDFHTQLFDHYQRHMPEVDGLLRDMFVGRVSLQQVGTVGFWAEACSLNRSSGSHQIRRWRAKCDWSVRWPMVQSQIGNGARRES